MNPHMGGQGTQSAVLARTGPAWEEEGLLNGTHHRPAPDFASCLQRSHSPGAWPELGVQHSDSDSGEGPGGDAQVHPDG